MGGKKKPAKKGKGDADEQYDPAQMTVILQAQVQTLKERLVLEQERKDKSKSYEVAQVNRFNMNIGKHTLEWKGDMR